MIYHARSLAILLVLSWGAGCADTTEPGSPSDSGGGVASGGGATNEGGTGEFGVGGGPTGGAEQCNAGEVRPCYPGDEADAGIGACTEGTQTCAMNGEFSSWSECEGYVLGSDDVCGDGIDNDCDGEVDPGCCVPMDYGLTTGFTANGGMVCCVEPGTLISVTDCGDGDNHWVETAGDCGVAYEGEGNNGGPCAAIQCQDVCD